MKALQLINTTVPVLKPQDTVAKALDLMLDAKQETLPVVDEQSYLGVLEESFIMNYDDYTLLKDLPLKHVGNLISENLELPELVDFLIEKEFTMAILADENNNYVGTVLAADAYKELALELYSGDGASIILHLGEKEYSLTEISRIVEQEGHHIQKVFVANGLKDVEDGHAVYLKLNTTEISSVLSSLKRFGYKVTSTKLENEVTTLEKERYELLMKYLEV